MLALTRAPEARCPSAEALETALLGRPAPPRRASVATRRLLALVAGVALVGALIRLRPRDPARAAAPTAPPAVRIERAEVGSTDGSVPAPAVDAATVPRAVSGPWYRRLRRVRDASVPRGTNGAPIVDDL
jgi:hypothetical protein